MATSQASSAAHSAFERALDDFNATMTPEDVRLFQNVKGLEDIKAKILELEKEQASRKKSSNINRIRPFIAFLERYEKVIEVFIGAKQELLSVIWGPLKLLLQITFQYTDAFDSFLTACENIGLSAPLLEQYARVFPECKNIQRVIILVYTDILSFYHITVKFFRRRAAHMILNLAWTDINSKIQNIIDNMKSHEDLVIKGAQAEDIERAERYRNERSEHTQRKIKDKISEKRKNCLLWLEGPNEGFSQSIRDAAFEKRTKNTGSWLLDSTEFKGWLEGKNHLWLNGKPGAGKTVLTSIALAHMESCPSSVNNNVPIIHFYCSYKIPEKNTHHAILRSLLSQLVTYNDELVHYLDDQQARSSRPPTFEKCQDLFNMAVQITVCKGERLYLVIDGLDELLHDERGRFLRYLSRLISPPIGAKTSGSSIGNAVCVYIASQPLPEIRKMYMRASTSGQDFLIVKEIAIGAKNRGDIDLYIKQETDSYFEDKVEDMRHWKENVDELKYFICQSLTSNADGMFLYVTLVMRGLFDQVNIRSLREEVEKLPKGLDQAYERIMIGIENLPEPQRVLAIRILGLMTVATRHLTVRELEDAVALYASFPSSSVTIPYDLRTPPITLCSVCGPLVELTNDELSFVHHSARKYLLHPEHTATPLVTNLRAHREMATISFRYMQLECFTPQVTADQLRSAVLNGELRLLEYVTSNWVYHLGQSWKDNSIPADLETSLQRIIGSFVKPEFQKSKNAADLFESSFDSQAVTAALVKHQVKRKSQPELDESSTFLERSRAVYEVYEQVLLEPEHFKDLQKWYGVDLFACQSGCKERFPSEKQRQSHTNRHLLQFLCGEDVCQLRHHSSRQALKDHMKKYHGRGKSHVPVVKALELLGLVIPPSGSTPTPQEPTPKWLTRALNTLKKSYQNDIFEGTMRWTATHPTTGLVVLQWEITDDNRETLRWKWMPRIKCSDCPGKWYTPGPGEGAENFVMHLRNRGHRERVKRRLAKEKAEREGAGWEEMKAE